MIDPFILQSLMQPPPAIVESAPLPLSQSSKIDWPAVERDIETRMAEKSLAFSKWVNAIELATEKSKNTGGDKATVEMMANLDNIVSMLDSKVVSFDTAGRKSRRENERLTKNPAFSREQKTILRRVSEKAYAQDTILLEGFIKMSRLVRVIRYNLDPKAGSGATFADPNDLEEYLRALVV